MHIQYDRYGQPDATPPCKLSYFDYKKRYLEYNFWIFMFWKHTGIINGGYFSQNSFKRREKYIKSHNLQ